MRTYKHRVIRKSKFDGVFSAGTSYGNWTVINPTVVRLKKGKQEYGCAHIHVKCSCGTTSYVEAGKLLHGHTRGCGCHIVSFNGNPNWKGYGVIPARYFNNVAKNAIRRGIAFELTIEYLDNLFKQQHGMCALTGESINFSEARKYKAETNASLDRIDNNVGYIEGNVQFVTKQVNFAKHKLSSKEFIELCRKVIKLETSK